MYQGKPVKFNQSVLDWLKGFLRLLWQGGSSDRVAQLELPRRHAADYRITVLVMILCMVGYVAMFSILPAITHGNDQASTAYVIKQFAFFGVGVLAFILASRLPLDLFRRYSARIFTIAFLICLALPIMGIFHAPIAKCALGACRWYRLAGVGTFQPAELLKLGALLFVASIITAEARAHRLNDWNTLWQVMAVLMMTLFVVALLQKDLGTGVAFIAIVLAQLVISGMRWSRVAIAVGIIVVAAAVSIVIAPHRLERVMTFVGSGNEESNYHINQAILALGSGGMFGRGVGKSVQAFGWLPEAVNDSIFAIIGEMTGWLGSVALIALFVALLWIIIHKVDYTKNYYLRLVLAGVFGWLSSHVIMNVGAMTHMIPLTGITLPLVSIGGTSLVFIMLTLGMVLGISRYTSHRRLHVNGEEAGSEDSLRGRRQRWAHYANRRGY